MEDSSRRRRLLLMTLGVVLALIAGGAAYYLGTSQPPPTAEVEMEDVVVATRDITARTELTAEDVAVRQIPASAVLPQALRSIEEAEGQLTGVPIFAGQQITPNLFIGSEQDPFQIMPPEVEEITDDTPTWRAFSISVPRNRAVGGLIQDGDHVDLIVSLDLTIETVLVPTEDEEGNIRLIAEDASSVGFVSPETGEVEGIRSGMTTKVVLSDLLILRADTESGLYVVRVDLEQAEQLTQIMRDPQVGSASNDPFTFALRSQADTREITTDDLGTTLDRVIERFLFRVPFLLDLSTLLGFPFEPIETAPAPGPAVPPATPSPEPPPEEEEP